jgi:predicted AAA+ superfamily ATPase
MSISRHKYLATIGARLRDNPVVSLVGPRQAGKTTLAKNFAEGAGETHFFDLESPSDLARLANPELVLSPLRGLVVLDEIQRIPALFPLLRVLADRPGTPAKFLILGSASSRKCQRLHCRRPCCLIQVRPSLHERCRYRRRC